MFAGVFGLVLAILGMPVLADNGTGVVGDVCLGQFVNPANCTANDVLIEEFEVVEVIESCSQGTLGEAEVVFNAIVVSNSPNRFGIGIFVNLEGESAITGSHCLHDFFSPVNESTNPADWPTVPLDNGNLAYVAPFPNINEDQCGDIPGQSRILKPLQQVRIQCNDITGDGFVDISACASWENNSNQQCGGLDDAVPGTPSKCGCVEVESGLALPASLTIRKETTSEDGSFEFETTSDPAFDANFALPETFSITTSGGEGSEDFGGLVEPGTYTIDEVVPGGWNLNSASCTNNDDPQSAGGGVTLGPGDDVTCTFVNAPIQPGTITIIKSTEGGDESFDFFGDLGSFQISTESGTGTETFADQLPGSFTVGESVPDGWDLTGISCQADPGSSTSVDDNEVAIELGEGGDVTCTFSNAKRGTIIVEKIADPADTEQQFAFSSDFAGDFTLGAGEDLSTGDLLPSSEAGAYSVQESVPDGWTLESASCDNGDGPGAINLDAGQTVTCTFTNAIDRGTIIVEKIALPDDTGEVFGFNSNFAGNFVLAHGDSEVTSGLLPSIEAGTYSVSEVVPDGWDLEAGCDGNGNTPEAIDLQPGQTVTCTFTNTQRGSLTFKKLSIGGDGTFDFVSNTLDPSGFQITTVDGEGYSDPFAGLEPGTYDAFELDPGPDWSFQNVSCDVAGGKAQYEVVEDDQGNIGVSIDLLPGQDATCTFENALLGTVSVTKLTTGGDDSFGFQFSRDGDLLDTFELETTGGSASKDAFDNFDGEPGSYSFEEIGLPDHWALTELYCTQIDADGNSSQFDGDLESASIEFELAFGDTVNCTFHNTRDGQIIIQKVTIPEGSNQTFEFVGPENSALNTTLGDGEQASDHFQPGQYTVAEIVPDGWADPSISCETGIVSSSEASDILFDDQAGRMAEETIELAAGETVTCVFTNTQLGSFTVVKETDPDSSTQTFEFTGDLAGTIGHGESIALAELVPGTYTTTEQVPDGWTLDDIDCQGTDPANVTIIDSGQGVSVDLQAAEDVTCTFTNSQLSTGIELLKSDGGIIVGQGSSFAYTLTYTNTGELDLENVTITETVPGNTTFDAGGSTSGWSCDDESAAGTTCEFGIGTLASGAEGSVQFGLNVDIIWEPDPDTGACGPQPEDPQVNNTASIVGSSANEDAEDSDSDTTPIAVFCDDVSGMLTVEKIVASGDQSQSFEFTGSDSEHGFGVFNLAGGDSQSFDLPLGTYSVSESVPAGWSLDSAECSGDSEPENIEIGPEGNVTCTFTNRQLEADIEIIKSDGGIIVGQGSSFVYTLSYTNTGELDLTDVIIGESVPANTTFDTSGPDAGAWDCSSGSCTYVIGDLPAGASGSIQFPLVVDMLWEPNPYSGLCGAEPKDPQVDNTGMIIGTSVFGEVEDSDSESTPISVFCEEIPIGEPVPIPTTSPAGLAALAIVLMGLAQIVLYRRRRIQDD